MKKEALTREQKDLLREWNSDEKKYKYTCIEGQAGNGKSFVALHIFQGFMKHTNNEGKKVLFAYRIAALAISLTSWLCNRLGHNEQHHKKVLNHLYFMFEDDDAYTSIYQMEVLDDDGQEILEYKKMTLTTKTKNVYSLIVVDEAHHTFGGDGAPGIFKQVQKTIFRNDNDHFLSKVEETSKQNSKHARMLLLTDDSKGTCTDIVYPGGYEVPYLNEVIRCCQKVLLTSQYYKRLNQDTTESIYNEYSPYEGKSTWVDGFPWKKNNNDTTNELFQTWKPFLYESGKAPKVPFFEISSNVEEIQDKAIAYNDVIERLVIPKTVTHMRQKSLYQCFKLKDLIFEEGSSPPLLSLSND